MRVLEAALRLVERVATTIAAVIMFAIMVIVGADVFMRYVFNSPFGWAYDLISLYLMAAVFFLVLSHTYVVGGHVSVDILQQKLPAKPFRVTEIVTTGVSFVVFVLIAWAGWHRMVDAFQQGDVLAGAIPWPTWPALALVPFGSGLLALRLAIDFVGHLGSLITGRDLIPVRRHVQHGQESFE
ncbi:TRAP transporter small permease [Enterovirga sp. CN4-39]|uniref:TRAP transporter small permease n=1 Tax=Enterovirga sp. CN4-39 TaxID=3400910 RepID=UPI003C0DCDE1